ncbi:hypothetical protein J1N35_025336 [Gossypium stocksii]|uniref:Uncharacterized protein n=1 Tax=Gossypium stocksii TaxID=47602 RepID=A0A9D3ZY64_9ROSI|nr:hypothetical protein J1N35_025336 [Gossypium stocksii]
MDTVFPKRAMTYAKKIAGNHVWCKDVKKEIKQNAERANTIVQHPIRVGCGYELASCLKGRPTFTRYAPIWMLRRETINRGYAVSSTPFELAPNMNLRRVPKGHLTFTRIRTNMDVQERDNQQRLCRYCRNLGHTKATCSILRDTLRPQHC